ncbi:MAG: PTS transporter subunit EIIC [Propioniciclava sp.]|uniref:PTS sugar transporter subunit IIC n=1 Tax=Propioniciclava sp. TaxID=2038686 RepID=UPI0039E729FC
MNDKVLPAVMAFVNTRPLQALKNGMLVVMPLTIVGSLFLLLANLPFPGYGEWLESIGLSGVLNGGYIATFALLGIVACVAITYNYVRDQGYQALPPAMLSLGVMALLMPREVTNEDGVTIGNVLPLQWTGSQGMISGIIIALVVGLVYCWFLKKNITIKMPDGVPPNVATAFTSLIPSVVILAGAIVVYGVLGALNTTLLEALYTLLQAPIQGVADTFGGVIVIQLMAPLLWFFGIHGSSIVSGVLTPFLLANTADNQAILDSGQALTLANGGKIVTQQFLESMSFGGVGSTLALAICMLLFAKSAHFKMMGRLGGLPGVFNINEPLMFGVPVVMNPILGVPFIITPVVLGVLQYVCLYTGLVPLYTGVLAPWTTPPIIQGAVIAGWQGALMQAAGLIVAILIYMPFVRKADLIEYQNEQARHAEHEAEAAKKEAL